MRLGLARERQANFTGELRIGVGEVAREWGWTVSIVRDEAGERESDVLLAVGNGEIYPDLLRRPHFAQRVLWYVEPLYRRGTSAAGLHAYLPTGRILDIAGGLVPPVRETVRFRAAREQAALVREPVANLARLRRYALAFDRIVADAEDRALAAAEVGLRVDTVPIGYHRSYAGPLAQDGERPIDVFFMGFFVGRIGRRQRLAESITASLEDRGAKVHLVTGGLLGDERRRTFEASRIVMDVHRIPGNVNFHRFILASAAGAALVTEPLNAPAPLRPGVHYLEANVQEMADQASELLADEPRRRRIVDAAQEMLRTEMSLENVLPRVLGPYMQPLGAVQ